MGEYVVTVGIWGREQVMGQASTQEEAARIAENLRNGGYREVNIRLRGDKNK